MRKIDAPRAAADDCLIIDSGGRRLSVLVLRRRNVSHLGVQLAPVKAEDPKLMVTILTCSVSWRIKAYDSRARGST